MSFLFCIPEHSSHHWSSVFQLTPKQCVGRPHVMPKQLNTAPAVSTLHPDRGGDPFLCGGVEESNFSFIEHEEKRKKPEHPVMCGVRLQFQTWNSLCSLSSPPSALPASPSASPATAEHSLDFLQILSIPTLCFSHLFTRQSFPRLFPISLGLRC